VAALVDNRQNAMIAPTADVVPLNDSTFDELRLFYPPDVGWRCGDYGVYVARKQFPQVKRFWLMEDDLRIDGTIADFFYFFGNLTEVDFLSAKFRPAYWDWYWWPHAQAKDVEPYACQFSLVRLSDSALDLLYAKRLKHSRQWIRRAIWPNDEAFVATTLANSMLRCADFNDFDRSFYSEESYGWEGFRHLQGPIGEPNIVHPVRFERAMPTTAMASARDRYSRRDSWLFAKRKAAMRRITGQLKW
jgi:hypothetical protein